MMKELRLIPLAPALVATPLAAQVEDCEAVRLDLPEEIAFAVRPYVACGLIASGNFGNTSEGGFPLNRCANLRESAAVMAEQELVRTMPDAAERRAYVAGLLKHADLFLRAARNRPVAVDPETQLPPCLVRADGTAYALNQ